MNPKCRRCAGLVIDDYGDVRCMLCGDRPVVPDAIPINNLAYRWLSTLCETCHVRAAQRGREKCIECKVNDRGRSHSQMIKDGLKRKQEALCKGQGL